METTRAFATRDYDLAATLTSGQAFRWHQQDRWWAGVIGNRWVRLRSEPGSITAETAGPVADWDWLAHYLQLQVDLGEVLREFPDDEPMRAAVTACRGLRLSNRLTQAVVWLVRSLPTVRDDAGLELADLKMLMAEPTWPFLLELFRVDRLAAAADLGPFESLRRRAEALDPTEVAPPPLLSGDDLAAMGLSPGPRFGEILKTVYREQLNERITGKNQASELARRLMNED